MFFVTSKVGSFVPWHSLAMSTHATKRSYQILLGLRNVVSNWLMQMQSSILNCFSESLNVLGSAWNKQFYVFSIKFKYQKMHNYLQKFKKRRDTLMVIVMNKFSDWKSFEISSWYSSKCARCNNLILKTNVFQ